MKKQVRFLIGGIVGVISLSISGCNLTTEESKPAQNPDLTLRDPQVEIRMLSLPDAYGYYRENSVVDIQILAKGSLGSDVNCSTTVSKQSLNSAEFSDVDNFVGCSTFSVLIGDVSGDLSGVMKLKARATDNNSKVAEAVKYILIKNDQRYLKADFTMSLNDGLQVDLDASETQQGETGEILSYQWKLYKKEDADYTTNASLVHQTFGKQTSFVLPQDGFYIVALTVTDAGGRKATTQKFFRADTYESLTPSFTVSFPSVSGSTPLPSGTTAPINIVATVTNPTSLMDPMDLSGANHFVWELYSVSEGVLVDGPVYRNTVESKKAIIPILVKGTYVLRLKVIDELGNQHHADQVIEIP